MENQEEPPHVNENKNNYRVSRQLVWEPGGWVLKETFLRDGWARRVNSDEEIRRCTEAIKARLNEKGVDMKEVNSGLAQVFETMRNNENDEKKT